MVRSELLIPKVWRSELWGVTLFLFLCVLSVWFSWEFPGTVITGKLLSFSSFSIVLRLPLLWFAPFITLMIVMGRIYNVRYVIDARGVEALVGRLSLEQRITRVRYEDIRSVEIDQSLWDRVLDIGTVLVSTAANAGVEVVLDGVAAPGEIQDMLQRERDSRQKAAAQMVQKVLEERAASAS